MDTQIHVRQSARVTDSPLESLIGRELNTVSFVRDYVELRIDYSIVRLLTDPSGLIDGNAWHLAEANGAGTLRRYIGRTVTAIEFDEHAHIRLLFDEDAMIVASLRVEDRSGPEALHFLPADVVGQVHTATMWIW